VTVRRDSRRSWLEPLALAGVAVVTLATGLRLSRHASSMGLWTRLYTSIAWAIDVYIGWPRLPTPVAILVLLAARVVYRARNLYDTTSLPTTGGLVPGSLSPRHLVGRTADGTYNDLAVPTMGAANTRFGRNVPLAATIPNRPELMVPNPRTVSHQLLTRHQFRPATTLNLFAAAWLQFMVHDWLSHGANQQEQPFEVQVRDEDWSGQRPMRILRTRPDPTRPPYPDDAPPSYVNTATHWWDGSQIYGSDPATLSRLRSHVDGQISVFPNGLLPRDPDHGVDLTGVNGNYWLGLSLLHTLFTREHNAICDRLKREYPRWSDDDLLDKARLVNAALMAKIHTVEWSTAILSNPTTRVALRGNWWGLEGETLNRAFGRLSHLDVVSGIPGSDTNHHAAPYSVTEEFVSVYRMHPLIQTRTFRDVSFRASREVAEQIPAKDLFYSFGTLNPGAITLHNYPRFMQELRDDKGNVIDLAATDILRIRERGGPRYNAFRELMHLPRVSTFEELTDNPEWAEEIRRVYDNDIDSVDLMVGLYAEPLPEGFGFSDTAFRIVILMASRRLKSDRFFTVDFTPAVYTQAGMDWIADNSMLTVLQRHVPELGPQLRTVQNAFAPWPRAGSG